MLKYESNNQNKKMNEKQPTDTLNNYESDSSSEKLTAKEFKALLEGYGLNGENPAERINFLKKMDLGTLALMLTDVNRKLQGSTETLVSENTMKVGEQPTVPVEYRYELFEHLMKEIAESPADINPGRIADALSLGLVILHPFKDGNGRTSRVLRLAFDESYDTDEYDKNFDFLSESRDVSRARGGMIAVGYIPKLKEGQRQDDPEAVKDYFTKLLKEENSSLYVGPAGYSEIRSNKDMALV